MADKEYSSSFRIIQRFRGGICVVTNGLSLSIIRMLESRDMNLTELSIALDASKTTVQTKLSKLESERIIASYPDERDSRSTKYCCTFLTLYSSGLNDEWSRVDFTDAVVDLYSENPRTHVDAVLLYASKLGDHNICWHPFMLAVGEFIGIELMRRHPDQQDLDTLLSDTFDVYVTASYPRNGLNVVVRSEDRSGVELAYLGYSVLGCLQHILFKRNGSRYDPEADVESADGREFTLRARLTGNSKMHASVADPESRSSSFHILEERFAIYQPPDGESVLVENEIMLNILRTLESGPMTVNELSSELDLRPVTVNSSIRRMIELGFVDAAESDRVRNARYRLIADRILIGDAKDANGLPGSTHDYIERFLDRESEFYETIYELHHFIVSSAGIGYGRLLAEIGKEVGTEVVRQNPGMTAKEFIDMVSNLFISRRTHIVLRSYVPIEFLIRLDPGMIDFELETSYFQSLVRTGLRLITGVEYPVWFTRTDDPSATTDRSQSDF